MKYDVNIIQEPKKERSTLARDIPIGTIFTGKIRGHVDTLFVRFEHYGTGEVKVYSLTNTETGHCWIDSGLEVFDYTPVKSLTVTV